jgi:hypothetical protein
MSFAITRGRPVDSSRSLVGVDRDTKVAAPDSRTRRRAKDRASLARDLVSRRPHPRLDRAAWTARRRALDAVRRRHDRQTIVGSVTMACPAGGRVSCLWPRTGRACRGGFAIPCGASIAAAPCFGRPRAADGRRLISRFSPRWSTLTRSGSAVGSGSAAESAVIVVGVVPRPHLARVDEWATLDASLGCRVTVRRLERIWD